MATKILVADDDPSIVRLLQVSLQRLGYAVITADDGAAALRQAREDRPDLILMDVMMPHVDGFEALNQLKQDDALRSIPVIMLTAKRHDADLIHGLEAGAVSYLTKPFNPTELAALVKRVLAESAGSSRSDG